jgi:ankyrin repeat protein
MTPINSIHLNNIDEFKQTDENKSINKETPSKIKSTLESIKIAIVANDTTLATRRIEKAVQDDSKILQCSAKDITPLHIAVMTGNTTITKLLINILPKECIISYDHNIATANPSLKMQSLIKSEFKDFFHTSLYSEDLFINGLLGRVGARLSLDLKSNQFRSTQKNQDSQIESMFGMAKGKGPCIISDIVDVILNSKATSGKKVADRFLNPQTLETLQRCNNLLRNVALHLKPQEILNRIQSLMPNKPILIHAGFNGQGDEAGHCTYLWIEKQSDGKFTIVHYDTGKPNRYKQVNGLYLCAQSTKNIPSESLQNSEGWAALFEANSFDKLYDALALLKLNGTPSDTSEIFQQRGQASGTCVISAIIALFRHQILIQNDNVNANKIDYKIFKALYQQAIFWACRQSSKIMTVLKQEFFQESAIIKIKNSLERKYSQSSINKKSPDLMWQLGSIVVNSSYRFISYAEVAKADNLFIDMATKYASILKKDTAEYLNYSIADRVNLLETLGEDILLNRPYIFLQHSEEEGYEILKKRYDKMIEFPENGRQGAFQSCFSGFKNHRI